MKALVSRIAIRVVLSAIVLICALYAAGQRMPRALIITGNGNVPEHKREYPPWIHEFQNDLVAEILRGTVEVEITEDLSVLRPDQLSQYDLVISNSLFLTPSAEQLEALDAFVSEGKAYLTLHCGILSLLNWNDYERFVGGIFIGGPSSVPQSFKVVTDNIEFWGYEYSFRRRAQHPVSRAVDDFVIRDELYYFQPSVREFNVLARAENLPVMWWHPVGKGKVMSLTLGHDEEAKRNPGYQQLLINGVRWLTGIPLIEGSTPRVFSNRQRNYRNFASLAVQGDIEEEHAVFAIEENPNTDLFKVTISPNGSLSIELTGKPGSGNFKVRAATADGLSSTRSFEVLVVEDGTENIASYLGNKATSSSTENGSGIFGANRILDEDAETRWSSAPSGSAWVEIDLTRRYRVGRVVLDWEASFAREYTVSGSVDGKNWKTLCNVSESDGERDELNFVQETIRFIRINCRERVNSRWGYSLYEVKVYEK